MIWFELVIYVTWNCRDRAKWRYLDRIRICGHRKKFVIWLVQHLLFASMAIEKSFSIWCCCSVVVVVVMVKISDYIKTMCAISLFDMFLCYFAPVPQSLCDCSFTANTKWFQYQFGFFSSLTALLQHSANSVCFVFIARPCAKHIVSCCHCWISSGYYPHLMCACK